MDLSQIRTALAAHGAPTRGRRYPPELREGTRAHICTCRASGNGPTNPIFRQRAPADTLRPGGVPCNPRPC